MKRVCDWLFCVACMVVAFVSPVLLLAADGPPEMEVVPLVDFSSVFTSLTSLVTTIVVGSLGIGLAIWVTRFLFRLVKSMSRG
ncbi:MAG: hypothetical protein LBC02_01950 [Planctomycetaceae bacterium]|jgi:hypothetical protein|nr:hypothetical protein [Planctomycetaceae bacterium]